MSHDRSTVFRAVGGFVVRHPWLVIGFWALLVVGLNTALPQLSVVAKEKAVVSFPVDAPSLRNLNMMAEEFNSGGSRNAIVVVVASENPLGDAQTDAYVDLADRIREVDGVLSVQDYVHTPALTPTFLAEDNKAAYMSVGLDSAIGTPVAMEQVERVTAVVDETDLAAVDLGANVTGPAATVVDATLVSEADLAKITAATVAMIALVLLIVYRTIVTALLPLVVVGVTMLVAQGTLSGLSNVGLGIAFYSIAFLTAIVLGAGVDYAIFVISRYHEFVRAGDDSDTAVAKATGAIGKVVAASACTVALAFAAMGLATLGIFSVSGPACAIGILVAFAAAMTLLPALLTLMGRRGWVRPRGEGKVRRRWHIVGITVVRRPARFLALSLVILLALSTAALSLSFSFDDRGGQPSSTDSNRGFAVLDEHFPVNSSFPQYLVIHSENTLRSSAALSDLEQMAARIAQLPNIRSVTGLTRPNNEPLDDARISTQAGKVGQELRGAEQELAGSAAQMQQLVTGAASVATGIVTLRDGLTTGLAQVNTILGQLTRAQQAANGARDTIAKIERSGELVQQLNTVGTTITAAVTRIQSTLGLVTPAATLLGSSPTCLKLPECVAVKGALQSLIDANNGGSFAALNELAATLKSIGKDTTISSAVGAISPKLASALSGLAQLSGAVAQFQRQTSQLTSGVGQLVTGSDQVADGVAELVEQVGGLEDGLGRAADLLRAIDAAADGTDSMGGFYLPVDLLESDEGKALADVFMSPDGKSVRYLIFSTLNPFSSDAAAQVRELERTAAAALPNTTLEGAQTHIVGTQSVSLDNRTYLRHDTLLIGIATLVIVTLVLIVLLRALVAPLYLMFSVVLSYGAALGAGVILFQGILDQDIAWAVPIMAFMVLGAVGADYNMLMISRIRDEAASGIRLGVIRAMSSTGSVITSAGMIFAVSMFGLMVGSVVQMIQLGFIIGFGLLLDTFLVRTITVPAMATLAGRNNWWPSKS